MFYCNELKMVWCCGKYWKDCDMHDASLIAAVVNYVCVLH